MREIKVRFWDDVNNRFWHGGQEGEVIGEESFQTYFKDGILKGIMLEPISYGFKDVDDYKERVLPSSVYTDLKDKNGNEIYDGDVLQAFDEQTGFVGWDQDICGFQVEWKDGLRTLTVTNKESLEVIGNIYENPNLLEGNAENE